MSLVALVVVGDGKGNVGIGQGRSAGTSAIQKGVEDAKGTCLRFRLPSLDPFLTRCLVTSSGFRFD